MDSDEQRFQNYMSADLEALKKPLAPDIKRLGGEEGELYRSTQI